MRSVFKRLGIRFIALSLYILDCRILIFCFTYIGSTIFCNFVLESFTFNNSRFPFVSLILPAVAFMVFCSVSYARGNGVHNLWTLLKWVSLGVFLAYGISCTHSVIRRENLERIQGFIGKEVYISATVEQIEDESRSIVRPNESRFGRVLVTEKAKSVLQAGDRCTFSGQFVEPMVFEDFDYRLYLYQRGIYSILDVKEVYCEKDSFSLLSLRSRLEKSIEQIVPEPEASLLIGIVLGIKRQFTSEFEDTIRNVGISHVISASGYNISILTLSVEKLFRFLHKKARTLIQLIFIWVYTIMAGIPASLLRAAAMLSIFLFSYLVSRSSSRHISIFLCITILLMFNSFLIFDIGFLLSLFSTISLIYFLKSLDSEKTPKILREYLLPTFSCTLFTLPITIGIFEQFSPVSVLVNFLVLPIIESTMIVGLLSVFLYLVSRSFSVVFMIPYLQLLVFKTVAQLFSRIGSISVIVDPVVLASFSYLLLFLFCIWKYPIRNEKYNYYIKKASKVHIK